MRVSIRHGPSTDLSAPPSRAETLLPMLATQRLCTDHELLLTQLGRTERLLIVQDLDGVCMGLVRDPITRAIDPKYVRAASDLAGSFYVLTNGEHIGERGVNGIVDRALQGSKQGCGEGMYLPGLAAGGVQFQDRMGKVSHPGVSDQELEYLATVPQRARVLLGTLLSSAPFDLAREERAELIRASVLENVVSPTINLNALHRALSAKPQAYIQLQNDVHHFMRELQHETQRMPGLATSFFLHLAPNLGTDASGGAERIRWGRGKDAGTTDFQFMLSGALKEAGLLVLLNHYYRDHHGNAPLGDDFSVRNAPREIEAMRSLAERKFDPHLMPLIIGVGDTVTSQAEGEDRNPRTMLRGGSDRGFLSLVQALGREFGTDNAVLYVDSSGGEVRRPGIGPDWAQLAQSSGSAWPAFHGITDAEDPLKLNFLFPGGHRQYNDFFCRLAEERRGPE